MKMDHVHTSSSQLKQVINHTQNSTGNYEMRLMDSDDNENKTISFENEKEQEICRKTEVTKNRARKLWWRFKFSSGKKKKENMNDNRVTRKDNKTAKNDKDHETVAADRKNEELDRSQRQRRKNAAIGEQEVKSNVEALELCMFLDNLNSWGII